MNENMDYNKILVDILFDNGEKVNLEKYTKKELERILFFAERSRVLCRILKILNEDKNTKNIKLYDDKLIYCKDKLNFNLKIIKNTQLQFSKSNIGYLIFKTIDDFPDIGDDIDILIEEKDIKEAINSILKLNPNAMEKGMLGLEYSKKEHFIFESNGFSTEIELYPKFCSQGETYLPEKDIISRGRKKLYYDTEIRIPTNEDRFLLTVVHNMFRHGGLIRIIDILNTLDFIRDNELDWGYIVSETKKSGILIGFLIFIEIIDKYSKMYNYNIRIPYELKNISPALKDKNNRIPFRISTHLLLITFTGKIFHDLLDLKFYSASKVFHSCYLHLIGRFLIFLGNNIKNDKILKKLGLKL